MQWLSQITIASARRWSCSRAGLGPFVSGKSRGKDQGQDCGRVQRLLGEDRLDACRAILALTSRPPETHVGRLERCVSADSWAGRAKPGAASCATIATAGRTRKPSRATTPIGRSTRSSRLLAAVSAPQVDEVEQDEDWITSSPVRRTGARREAQDGRIAHRGGAAGTSSPGARSSRRTPTWPAAATSRPSSPPTSGRCTWAKAPTSTQAQRVLPPHVPDRGPEATCSWGRFSG